MVQGDLLLEVEEAGAGEVLLQAEVVVVVEGEVQTHREEAVVVGEGEEEVQHLPVAAAAAAAVGVQKVHLVVLEEVEVQPVVDSEVREEEGAQHLVELEELEEGAVRDLYEQAGEAVVQVHLVQNAQGAQAEPREVKEL